MQKLLKKLIAVLFIFNILFNTIFYSLKSNFFVDVYAQEESSNSGIGSTSIESSSSSSDVSSTSIESSIIITDQSSLDNSSSDTVIPEVIDTNNIDLGTSDAGSITVEGDQNITDSGNSSLNTGADLNLTGNEISENIIESGSNSFSLGDNLSTSDILTTDGLVVENVINNGKKIVLVTLYPYENIDIDTNSGTITIYPEIEKEVSLTLDCGKNNIYNTGVGIVFKDEVSTVIRFDLSQISGDIKIISGSLSLSKIGGDGVNFQIVDFNNYFGNLPDGYYDESTGSLNQLLNVGNNLLSDNSFFSGNETKDFQLNDDGINLIQKWIKDTNNDGFLLIHSDDLIHISLCGDENKKPKLNLNIEVLKYQNIETGLLSGNLFTGELLSGGGESLETSGFVLSGEAIVVSGEIIINSGSVVNSLDGNGTGNNSDYFSGDIIENNSGHDLSSGTGSLFQSGYIQNITGELLSGTIFSGEILTGSLLSGDLFTGDILTGKLFTGVEEILVLPTVDELLEERGMTIKDLESSDFQVNISNPVSGFSTDKLVEKSFKKNQIKNLYNKFFEKKGFKRHTKSGGLLLKQSLSLEQDPGVMADNIVLESDTLSAGNTIQVEIPEGTLFKNTYQENYRGVVSRPQEKGIGNQDSFQSFKVGSTEEILLTDENGNSIQAKIIVPIAEEYVGKDMDVTYSYDNVTWEYLTTVSGQILDGNPVVVFYTDHFTYFSIGTSIGTFFINNNEDSTISSGVVLNIQIPGATHMRFANTVAGVSSASWGVYASGYSWTLVNVPGLQTVYAQFSGSYGIQSIQDSILLDTTTVHPNLRIRIDGILSGTTLFNQTPFGVNYDFSTYGGLTAPILSGEQVMSFNGSSQYAETGNIGITGYPFTISAWVNTDTLAGTDSIVMIGDSSVTNRYYGLQLLSGKPSVVARNTTTRNGTSQEILVPGKRYHIVGVFNSATQRYIYVNGVRQQTNTSSVNFSTANQTARIGRYVGSSANYFDGYIDDVRIYSTGLTNQEIFAMYQTRVGGFERPIQYLNAGEFIINSGDTKTYTGNVALNTTVSGATHMRFGNTTGERDVASWIPYTNTYNRSIDDTTSGNRIVYAQFSGVGTLWESQDNIYFEKITDTSLKLVVDGTMNGTTVLDSTSNGYNLTAVGSLTNTNVLGEQVLGFNGTNQYTQRGSIGITAYPFTFSAWVNTDTLSATDVILSMGNSSANNSYYAIQLVNGAPSIVARNTTTRTNTVQQLMTGRRYHIAGVFNSNTSRTLYLNGVPMVTATTTATFSSTNQQVRIGRYAGSLTSYFDGYIDDARIYSRSVTSGEILTMYQQRETISVVPVSNIVYSTTSLTTGDVVATLTGFSEDITILNNNGLVSYTFTGNGEFTFLYEDSDGNQGSTIAYVDWITNSVLTYSGDKFSENSSNDGSVTGNIIINLTGDSFSTNVVSSGLVYVSNIPSGLTGVFIRDSSNQINFFLSGNAINHANLDDVNNVIIVFNTGAFVTLNPNQIINSTKNGILIDFIDPYLNNGIFPSADTMLDADTNVAGAGDCSDGKCQEMNYGTTNYLCASDFGSKVIMKFDLSSIPNGSVITSAKIRLNRYNIGTATPGTGFKFTKIINNASWIEGTQDTAAALPGEPNYKQRKWQQENWNNGSPGLVAGVDYVNTHLLTVSGFTGNNSSTYNQEFLFNSNGISTLQDRLDIPSNNQGFSMGDSNDGWLCTRSKEYGTVGDRPLLTLTYALDTQNPIVSLFDPLNNQTGISVTNNLYITFDENVWINTGKNIYIRKLSDSSIVETISVASGAVSIIGNIANINPVSDFVSNTGYYIEMQSGAFIDRAGNSFSGFVGSSTWKFYTIDTNNIPTVTGAYYTGVDYTGAILGGIILTTGFSNIVERGVYWSTTSGFNDGAGTKVYEIGNRSSTGFFTGFVSGLPEGTNIYFKAFAKNSEGNGYSLQNNFVTKPGKPVFGSSTNLSNESFQINWNAVTGATAYYLHVSKDSGFATYLSGYGPKVITGLTYEYLHGLVNNTGYYYKIMAGNSAGYSITSDIQLTTTTLLPGPIVWLKLEETAGVVAYDSTANNHDGVISGSPLKDQIGAEGKAFYFDGLNDDINVVDFVYGLDFSIHFWFKTTHTGNNVHLFSHGTDSYVSGSVNVMLDYSSQSLKTYINGNQSILNLNMYTGLVDGNWHLYTLTINDDDQVSGKKKSTVYIDSVERITNSTVNAGSYVPVHNIVRGRVCDSPNYFFTGYLDDLRIYPQDLTSGEIESIYYSSYDIWPPIFSGIETGGYYNTGVIITFSDLNLSGAILSGINGNMYYSGSFTSGSYLIGEGTYYFTAFDTFGNSTGAIFTIDTTPPNVTGVASGQIYNTGVYIDFSDLNLSGAILSGLNGNTYYSGSFNSGTLLTGAGNYIFTVIDIAGNQTQIIFSIVYEPLTIGGITGFNFSGNIYSLDVNQNIDQQANDYLWVNDPEGSNSGYFTTVSISDFSGQNSSISSGNIYFKGNAIQLINGSSNSGVVLASGMVTYQLINTPKVYIKREIGSYPGITGKYGDKFWLSADLPAYVQADNYHGLLTYTLYEN